MSEPPAEPPVHQLRCSFCRVSRAEARFLVTGPDVSICDACVQLGVQILIEDTAEPVPPHVVCSFCRKARSEVEVLIPGAAAYICDECLRVSGEILGQVIGPGGVPQLPVARVRKPRWWQRWSRRD